MINGRVYLEFYSFYVNSSDVTQRETHGKGAMCDWANEREREGAAHLNVNPIYSFILLFFANYQRHLMNCKYVTYN